MSTAVFTGPSSAQLIVRRCALNDFYRQSIETPELRQAIELHAWATREREQLPPTPQLPLPDSLADDLDAFRALPAQLAAAERDRAAMDGAYVAVIRKCESRIQSVIHRHDAAITRLAPHVAEIMAGARQLVTQLGGARNAAEAIKLGTARTYQELQPLSDKLDRAFQAHDWLLPSDYIINHRSEYIDDPWVTDCRIANLDEVLPAWKHAPRNTALQSWDSPRLQPWSDNPVDRLIWFCTNNVQLRPATTKQLRELKTQRLRDRAHPDGEPQQQRESIVLNEPPRTTHRVVGQAEVDTRRAELAELKGANT
jgi:hypothetical protein